MNEGNRKSTGYNSTYKKLAVQWLNEALCFVSSLVVADSFRLRNRQLLVAANRYGAFINDIMKDKKVTIPKPCNEGWDTMTPNDNGRHCDSCNKTVVDFTTMTLEQIKLYFDKNNGAKVCGHFKVTQVEKHIPALHRQLIRLYEYLEQTISIRFFRAIPLSIVTLCMVLVGCQEETTTGEPLLNEKCNHSEQHLTGDTTYIKHDSSATVDGEPMMDVRDTAKGEK